MQIIERNITELIPADYNPRHKSEHVLKSIKESIKDYGWLAPVVVNTHQCDACGDRRNVIVGGHRRLEAAKENNEQTVPTIEVNLHIADEKRANLRLNAQERFKKTDLAIMFEELHRADADKAATLGFSAADAVKMLATARFGRNQISGVLAEKFLHPPFSVLNTRDGNWQTRKRQWKELMGDIGETRETTLAGGEKNLLMRSVNDGVSTFDPVLTELMYYWFAPEKAVILDPFAGGQTRSFLAAALGHDYHGVDIRQDQIDVDKKAIAAHEMKGTATFYCGDSRKLDELIPESVRADLLFTCPPYYDLEIYSGVEGDLSAKQSYDDFMRGYTEIFEKAAARVKPDRFAVLVLGDVRDDKGFYRNFLLHNIEMMERLGFKLYNELILVEATGTAPYRAERNMRKRKVVKTHQNVYAFIKGDLEKIRYPEAIEAHKKVLAFFRGDPDAIQSDFKNPPIIERDVFAALESEPDETE